MGLSPMDGVTDLAMRMITLEESGVAVDLMMTEFVNVEGLIKGAAKLWRELWTNEVEGGRIVAQLYGLEPKNFKMVAERIASGELGEFSGIDLNMGCPARAVALNGAGAGLIRDRGRAKEIFEAVKEGVAGRLAVSIKTRLGYEAVDHGWSEWILGELEPAALSLHGRTFRQGYSGVADWSAIGEVVKMAREMKSETVILGNGDVRNRAEAKGKCAEFGVDGVLIGRAAMGDPWVFREKSGNEVDIGRRARAALKHARLYEKIYGEGERYNFLPMRKHLAWYIKGVEDAKDLRVKLCQTNSSEEVAEILREYL